MITVVVFPTNTINIFQTLDFIFFGALKKFTATATDEFDDNSINDHITELVHDYEQKATSMTIRGLFGMTSMYPYIYTTSFKLSVMRSS
jgi:hypothetical protein